MISNCLEKGKERRGGEGKGGGRGEERQGGQKWRLGRGTGTHITCLRGEDGAKGLICLNLPKMSL